MGVNKVTLNTSDGEETVMDITDTTATPETVAEGAVFYGADGEQYVGTAIGGIPVPETAAVGQTVVVRAVDDNGKPAEWGTGEFIPCPTDYADMYMVPMVMGPDENGKPAGWGFARPVFSVNGKIPGFNGALTLDLGAVKPADLAPYAYRTHFESAGMLTTQGAGILPTDVRLDVKAAQGNGVMLFLDAGGTSVVRLAAGKLWEVVPLPVEGVTLSDIAFGNGVFVCAITDSSTVLVSSDGFSWEEYDVGMALSGARILFDGSGFLITNETGTGTLVYSKDGCNWDFVYNLPSVKKVVYGNGTYVGIDASDPIYAFVCTGSLSDYWEVVELPYTAGDIAYGEGLFVATASDQPTVMLSHDGKNWTSGIIVHDNGMMIAMESVTYGDGRFVFLAPSDVQYGGGSVTTTELIEAQAAPLVAIHWPILCEKSVTFVNGQFLFVLDDIDDETRAQMVVTSNDGGYNLYGLTADVIIPPVLTINGQAPDANGNVEVEGGGGSYSDWTEEEKATVVADVIAALPVYNGEVEDV